MKDSRTRVRFVVFVATVLAASLPVVAAASEAADGAASHLGIPDTLWKTLNLVLFVFLLLWFAGRPIAVQLRKRREKIASDLADAAKKRDEAARTEEEIRRKIAELETDIADFARKAREDGEREKIELAARGEAEAAKILVQAREEVQSLGSAARRDLAAYAGELAAELAATAVEAKMGPAEKAAFLERSIAEIGKSEAGR